MNKIMTRKGENIYKRKDNRWEGRYKKGVDEFGKVKFGYVYGYTYKETKEKLVEEKNKFQKNMILERKINMAYVSEQWLCKEYLIVKQSTYAKYYAIVHKHILPYLGTNNISNIDSSTINAYLTQKLRNGRIDKKGPLSPKTVRDIFTILKSILQFAEEEYGFKNIRKNAVLPKKIPSDISVLSKKECLKLEQYSLEDLSDYRRIGLYLCLYTGMRIGEICALRWRDIDLVDGILHIQYTLQRIQNCTNPSVKKTSVIIDTPKSLSSIRKIPLQKPLLHLLKKIKKDISDNAFFLSGKEKKFIEPRNYQYYFQKCLEKLELSSINFHALRHTFSTRCVEAGFDIKSLSEILGHSDTNITLKYYVYSSIHLKREQMERLTS